MQVVQAVCQECSLEECNSVEDYEVPATPCIEFITQSGRSDDPVRYEVCEKHLATALGLLIAPNAVAQVAPAFTRPEFVIASEDDE